ncbi:mitochondrial rRNA methyltransferase 2 [Arctopsyche grandis]|uniref:mitochondrial rRNA methyltransferase 2 n=1 Tax=Arctopsyche grandis TaxID=121162 RepID=UPI00406D87B3
MQLASPSKMSNCILKSRTIFANVALANIRRKGTSSNDWLQRQLTDPYVEKAKIQNYRCRSAFKLLEMNEKGNFLQPGQVVVDIGAAPGSWTQVAVQKVNSNKSELHKPVGKVFAIDRQQIFPIEGATILSNLDFESEETQTKLKEALGDHKVNVVLSDMAPNASGVKAIDQDKIISLCYKAFRFAAQVSTKNACLLVKVWDGVEVPILELDLGRFYKGVKIYKPPSSRSDSSEKFLFASGFKGLQT